MDKSDIFVDNGDGTFTHTTVDGDIVTFDANTTTMVNNGDGTYTFTNKNGDTITVDVIADVVNNIVNEGDIYDAIMALILGGSDIFVDNGNGTFTHTTVDGVIVTRDANTTTMVNNGDGTYTFTNKNGDTITVDVIADDVNNIVNEGDIYDAIMALILGGSDIFVDNGNGTFTHTTVDGDIVTFDANTTTMVNNGDGTYTFTNKNGDTITVDVIADVVNNIVNEGDIYDAIMALILGGSDIFVDNGNGTFTHTTVDGVVVTFDANTTTMVNNGDGTYTFTNDNGDTITVDVISDVVNNIQTQGAIYDEIMALILGGSDIFIDNGNGTFTHTTVDGVVVTFDANTTTMVDNGDGTYTFTNKNGDTITVDVIGDVVNNIQTQGAIYDEIMALILGGSDIFIDNGNGTFTHTTVDGVVVTFDANTTTMVDNGDGTYTFTNKNGDTITVDVIGDVVNNIQTQGAIYDEIISLIGDPVTADNGLTKTADNIQLGGNLINPTTITTDATSTLAIAGLQPGTVEDRLVVVETDGTLREVKAAMPKFFYMPAIIFDTSVNGTFTRDLHAEYAAQFQGTGNPLLVSSTGAASAIPTLPASALEYHITYYDTTVFTNLSIDANGVLTYDNIGNATEASYMTIVFVVK